MASPRRADAHRRRARLGDGHQRELHAERVGPGGGDRQTELGRRACRRHRRRGGRRRAGGIAVSSSGSGWTTNGPATTTGPRPRSMMSRAVDPMTRARRRVLARASTGRSGRSRARGRSAWTAAGDVGVDLDVDAWVVGSVPRACAAFAADASSSKSETATVTVWMVAPNRAARCAGRRQRALRELGAVERHQDGAVTGSGARRQSGS